MNWFHNLRTGTKLHVGFGSMILFLGATAWVAISDTNRLQKTVEELYERDFTTAFEMSEIRVLLNRERVDMLNLLHLPTGSGQGQMLDSIKASSAELDARLQSVASKAVGEPDLAARIREVKDALADCRKERDRELSLVSAGKMDEALMIDRSEQTSRYERLHALTGAVAKDAANRAKTDVSGSGVETRASNATFIGITAAALLFGVSLAILMNRAIASPLVSISGMAEKIATGDLTVEVPRCTRTDEVGVMQTTFRKMVSSLREVTRQIREATGVLAAAATEIMAATTQMASSAAETASAVAQTTTTLEEVKQTSQVSNQKAKAVSDEARKAVEVAGSGRQSVERTIEGMEGIQRQMSAIAESVVNLSAQSQAIGEIITSVDDLAAQSKLLAVNASIEAAKAGEDGKGFGVVAQEVKSLAEQSKQATAQVRAILSDIQKATGSAVIATEQGGKAVEAGVVQSNRAGESIGALTENIAQAAQAATQIAATSQQQFVGVDQVALAMDSIKTASTQTVASTRQAEAAAQQLHELGQNLKLIVERFKV